MSTEEYFYIFLWTIKFYGLLVVIRESVNLRLETKFVCEFSVLSCLQNGFSCTFHDIMPRSVSLRSNSTANCRADKIPSTTRTELNIFEEMWSFGILIAILNFLSSCKFARSFKLSSCNRFTFCEKLISNLNLNRFWNWKLYFGCSDWKFINFRHELNLESLKIHFSSSQVENWLAPSLKSLSSEKWDYIRIFVKFLHLRYFHNFSRFHFPGVKLSISSSVHRR